MTKNGLSNILVNFSATHLVTLFIVLERLGRTSFSRVFVRQPQQLKFRKKEEKKGWEKTRVHLQTIFFVFFVVVSLHKFSLLLPSMEVSKRAGLNRRGEHYKTWTAHPSVGIQVIF
jgi:ABC-type Fe3+ transport system permease subunit